MKQEKIISLEKFAIQAGCILMLLPSFYWLGVALAMVFNKPLIVSSIMLPVDRTSSLFTVLIMIGLPCITIMVNLKSLISLRISVIKQDLLIDAGIRRNKYQFMLIVYAAMTIGITMTYYFFEKFVFFSSHY